MKRILITGGCGYLGSILANFLNKKEFKIYVLDNLSNSSKKFLDKNITFYRLDLNIKKHITSIFKKNNFDTIIHLAAKKSVIESQKKPHLYFKENSENSLILFKIAKKYKVKNFIFISSAAVYGNYSKKIVTKTLTKPISVYGKSKLKAEKMLIKNSSSKIKLVVLRLFNLAGADIDNLIGNNSRLSKDVFCYLIDSFEKKKIFKLFGSNFKTKDGTCVRNFIHVNDVVRIIYLILKKIKKKEKLNRIINVCSPKSYSINEIILAFQKYYKKSLVIKKKHPRKNEIVTSDCCSNYLTKNLKYTFRFSSLSNLISSTVKWQKYLS